MYKYESILKTAKLVTLICVIAAGVSYGKLRKAALGDKMPEFSLPDANAAEFMYKHGEWHGPLPFINLWSLAVNAKDSVPKVFTPLRQTHGTFTKHVAFVIMV